ncbi:MAG: deaminase [Chloroflexi bacterium]|nr:MAG: deaminase [Chloroflexota bacterium]
MRKVIYSLSMSLDGFMEGPNNDLSWVLVDEEFHRFSNEQAKAIDTSLYGRGLYETMRYWDTADTLPGSEPYEVEFAQIWQKIPKVVFSTTLQEVGPNARLVRGNVAEEVNRLKAQPGQAMDVGGAGLAATFMRLGLIDEIQVFLQPVAIGSGTPMFQIDETVKLHLIEARPFTSGVVFLRYETDYSSAS